MGKKTPQETGFYRASRRLFAQSYRARVTAFAVLAAGAPLVALAATLFLFAAPFGMAVAVMTPAALCATLGVLAVHALTTPVEAHAATFPECEGADAIGRAVQGAEALRSRLAVATRQRDPASLDDALTGLPNRLAAMRRGRDEITRARRAGDPLSVAVIAFRDDSAAPTEIGGLDVALRYAAEALVQGLRAYDVVARWDGACFVALLPEAEIEHAVAALQRIAEMLEPELARRGYGRGFELIAGAAVLQPEDATLADIAQRAQAALDRARSGFGPAIAAAPGPRSRPANLSSV